MPRSLTRSNDFQKPTFLRAWHSISYLHPGLHPDGYESADSGWAAGLRRFAAEAWRRADAGELGDEELYPSDVQWRGLYDRLTNPTPAETDRRREIAILSARTSHA